MPNLERMQQLNADSGNNGNKPKLPWLIFWLVMGGLTAYVSHGLMFGFPGSSD